MTTFQNVKSAVELKGEEWVLNVLNRHQENMEYRKAYSKRRNAENREILAAFKSGKLSFGGTRVNMTVEQEEEA